MGVTIEKIRDGDSQTYPKKGQKATVHYVATLEDGTQFDSSRDRGKPFTFQVGCGLVIKGWDEGITQMSVGERAKLICTPDYGYGLKGYPGVYPFDMLQVNTSHIKQVDYSKLVCPDIKFCYEWMI